MLLAINVGNTNTKAAVFAGEQLVAGWRVRTVAYRTADEYSVLIKGLFAAANLNLSDIDGVVVSTVVPATVMPLATLAKQHFSIDNPVFVDAKTAGIDTNYIPKTDVGADRLANAVGAHALYSGPVIVVDFGTATTFDAIASDGTYLGGAIAPGIEISIEALVSRTSQLRRVQFVRPERAIGVTTVESIQSGVLFGFAGQVDSIVARFKEEMGQEARVIATGGLAELVAAESKTIEEVCPDLTLVGLRLIYEKNVRD